MVVCCLCTVLYLYAVIRFRDSILPIHEAVLGMLVLALAEAVVGNVAYILINLNGQPYCCPFPPIVVADIILLVCSESIV
jgi:hypothetical protein